MPTLNSISVNTIQQRIVSILGRIVHNKVGDLQGILTKLVPKSPHLLETVQDSEIVKSNRLFVL